MLINCMPSHNRHAVFLTDAKSVLQAVKDPKNTSMNEHMACLLYLISTTKETVLQWIPGHCGIPGNGKADLLARKEGSLEQIESDNMYYECKIVKSRI